MLMKKTEQGTISASTVDIPAAKGIAVGLYKDNSVASFESNGNDLFLLINSDFVKKHNIKVLVTDGDWKVIGTMNKEMFA